MMVALAFDWDAIIAGHLAPGAGRLKGELADGTRICIFDIPFPCCNCMPVIEFDFHWNLNSVNKMTIREIISLNLIHSKVREIP